MTSSWVARSTPVVEEVEISTHEDGEVDFHRLSSCFESRPVESDEHPLKNAVTKRSGIQNPTARDRAFMPTILGFIRLTHHRTFDHRQV